MAYRTRTYIAADWDGDHDLVDQLHKWNESDYWGLHFQDAHDLTQSRDTSKACSIKKSLRRRLDCSKIFVLIVGDKTTSIMKGACWYCPSYIARTESCAMGEWVDDRSFVEFECHYAWLHDDEMRVVVLYNDVVVNREKCPADLYSVGKHIAARHFDSAGNRTWDYQAVKKAMEG